MALNNPMDLKADIRPVRLVKERKPRTVLKTTLGHYGGLSG